MYGTIERTVELIDYMLSSHTMRITSKELAQMMEVDRRTATRMIKRLSELSPHMVSLSFSLEAEKDNKTYELVMKRRK